MELNRSKKHFSKQLIDKAVSEVEAGLTREEVCQKQWYVKDGKKTKQ
jgi:hypothetical protein